jgi:hypothetical protein
MLELRPVETFAGVTPRPKVLLPDFWIKVSDSFPDALDHVRGKTMKVLKTNQIVWPVSKIIKEGCYVDLNLSNDNGQELLYPNDPSNMYEVLIALYPGNYYLLPYFPAGQPIWRLDEPTMTPTMNSATLKYLGAIRPSDSPVENPVFKLYLFYKLKPVILRVVADDGVGYEKCRMEFQINRCKIAQDTPPANVTPKFIPYLDELKW